MNQVDKIEVLNLIANLIKEQDTKIKEIIETLEKIEQTVDRLD